MQKIYWLSIETTDAHSKKAALLHKRGYKVLFFRTLAAMVAEIRQNRVSIIIIGDEGSEYTSLRSIAMLANMPEIQGCRLIYSSADPTRAMMKAACCNGVRDILPLYMPSREWLERFLFAIGAKDTAIQSPSYALCYSENIKVNVPARVVSISATKIRLESRLAVEPGQTVHVTGPIAKSMGLKSLAVTIEGKRKDRLVYRFSDSFHGSWTADARQKARVDETLALLAKSDTGKKLRVFLAIQSPALRNSLIRQLDETQYDTHTALIKRSIVEEPRYFSPHILIIEQTLLGEKVIQEMVSGQNDYLQRCKVIVMGADGPTDSQRAAVPVQMTWLKSMPADFSLYLQKTIIDDTIATKTEPGLYFLPPEDSFSMAEVLLDGQLTTLHPEQLQFRLPAAISNFGLLRIESPLLKKTTSHNPFVKVTGITSREAGAVEVTAHFCNYIPDHKESISRKIVDVVSAELLPRDEDNPAANLTHDNELGADLDSLEAQIERLSLTDYQLPESDKKAEPQLMGGELTANDAREAAPRLYGVKEQSFSRDSARKKRSMPLRILRYALILIALVLGGSFGAVHLKSFLEPHYKKSGKVFSDNIRLFRKGAGR